MKDFADLLAVLDQNLGTDWRALIGLVEIVPEGTPDSDASMPDKGVDLDDERAAYRRRARAAAGII